jgi:hypothetical protein
VEGNSIGEYRDDKGIVLGFVFKNMLNNKRWLKQNASLNNK